MARRDRPTTSREPAPFAPNQMVSRAERGVGTARAAVLLGVIAMVAINRDLADEFSSAWLALLGCGIYVVITALPGATDQRSGQLATFITATDVILITALIYVTGGVASPYYPIYYLPVLQAAVRMSMRDAVAAAVLSVGFYAMMAFAESRDEQVAEAAFLRARTFGGISLFVAILCGILMRETRAHRQRVVELGLIHQISKRAQATLAMDDLLASVVRSIRGNFPYERVAIYLRDKQTGRPTPAAMSPEGNGDPGADLESALTDVLQTGELVVASGGDGSALCVPLGVAESVAGILCITAERDVEFDTQAIHLAETLADVVAGSLKNARLYEETLLGAMRALSAAIDAKHPYTHGHTQRVTAHAMFMARELGMPKRERDDLELAALLHDVGKIASPDGVLDKPDRLTREEWAIIREHPVRGADMIGHIAQMEHVADIIRHHHERWDGSGYPDALSGEAIPLGARILALADAYDAMTTARAYKQALSPEHAVSELRRCAGDQFDPGLVEAACGWADAQQRGAAEAAG